MIAYQLSIFAENKSGKLAQITGVLAKEKTSKLKNYLLY